MECIFCKIVDGLFPSYTIYEDNILKIFLDINPDSNGHVLIVPKKHITNIDDMDIYTWGYLLDAIKKIKKKLEDKLLIDGLTIIENNGDVQEVKHFHIHLKPFYNNKNSLIEVSKIYDILK